MFSFTFWIFCGKTVLQGMWGEPQQMPDMSTANTIEAEAIFRMNNRFMQNVTYITYMSQLN